MGGCEVPLAVGFSNVVLYKLNGIGESLFLQSIELIGHMLDLLTYFLPMGADVVESWWGKLFELSAAAGQIFEILAELRLFGFGVVTSSRNLKISAVAAAFPRERCWEACMGRSTVASSSTLMA